MLLGEFGPVRAGVYRRIERDLARETDALIAVSPEVRDELVEIGVAPASQFAVVRLGIELSERMEGAERGGELRASLGIPPERFTVGWVARMTAGQAAGRRPPARSGCCTIAGSTPPS